MPPLETAFLEVLDSEGRAIFSGTLDLLEALAGSDPTGADASSATINGEAGLGGETSEVRVKGEQTYFVRIQNLDGSAGGYNLTLEAVELPPSSPGSIPDGRLPLSTGSAGGPRQPDPGPGGPSMGEPGADAQAPPEYDVKIATSASIGNLSLAGTPGGVPAAAPPPSSRPPISRRDQPAAGRRPKGRASSPPRAARPRC